MSKILIVEDDQNIRETLRDILEIDGHEVLDAKDGREGFDTIWKCKPNLVLCDVNMPEMDGFELLELVRDVLEGEVPPFIFLTAKIERNDRRKGMSLGAEDYITKPFSNKELLEAVEAQLLKRSAMQKTVLHQERARMEVELHNGVQPFLVAARMNIKGLTEKLSTDMPAIKDKLMKAEELLEQAIVETRNLSHNIVPKTLKEDGIAKYLLLIITPLMTSGRIEFEFDCQVNKRYPIKVELLMSRAIQEMISNTLKHADAQKIALTIFEDKNNGLHIQYSDDGNGFDPKEVSSDGIGMCGLQKSLTTINGHLECHSEQGKGTSFEVFLPHPESINN